MSSVGTLSGNITLFDTSKPTSVNCIKWFFTSEKSNWSLKVKHPQKIKESPLLVTMYVQKRIIVVVS